MKVTKKIFALVLSLVMVASVITAMPTETQAAIKVLTGKKATLEIGEEYSIVTTTSGVKYSSSNKKVATVKSNGEVKAKKAGTCTIKLKSSSGSASVKITVKPKKPTKVKAKTVSTTTTGASIKVSWKKVKGASGYYVYRSTKKNKGYKKVKTIKKGKTTKVTLKNQEGGKTYYYKVKAYAKAGKKKVTSNYSSAAKIRVYKLVWSDEFNGTSLDMNTWTYETPADDTNGGWGNQELQEYTVGKNVKFEDGKLVIVPRLVMDSTGKITSYTSTRIKTKGKKQFKYGKMEIRAKSTKGQGTWSAGWMLGTVGTWPVCGEIDIFESMNGGVPQTVHCPAFNNSKGNKNYYSGLTQATAAAEYHTYGVIWNEDTLEFYVDGKTTGIYDPSLYNETLLGETWSFDDEFFFILNCAIGGNAAGTVSTNGWTLVSNSNGVKTYEDYCYIDYVRVYK